MKSRRALKVHKKPGLGRTSGVAPPLLGLFLHNKGKLSVFAGNGPDRPDGCARGGAVNGLVFKGVTGPKRKNQQEACEKIAALHDIPLVSNAARMLCVHKA